MDEVRRFLRYTLPGLAGVIQFLIALSITDACIVSKIVSVKDQTQSLGLALTIFIGSGGLGYLFANIYFLILVEAIQPVCNRPFVFPKKPKKRSG